jgi:hypothetical protein
MQVRYDQGTINEKTPEDRGCVYRFRSGKPETEADAGTRTPDPLLTMEVLYQLSYVGAEPRS